MFLLGLSEILLSEGGGGGGVGVFLHTFEHVYHVRHVLPFARVTCRYPCLLLKVLAEY